MWFRHLGRSINHLQIRFISIGCKSIDSGFGCTFLFSQTLENKKIVIIKQHFEKWMSIIKTCCFCSSKKVVSIFSKWYKSPSKCCSHFQYNKSTICKRSSDSSWVRVIIKIESKCLRLFSALANRSTTMAAAAAAIWLRFRACGTQIIFGGFNK